MKYDVNRSVQLIGSLPCETAQEAMASCGHDLAGYAHRIPDGETHGWINFSIASLAHAKGVERNDVAGDIDAPAYASADQLTRHYETAVKRGAQQPRLRIKSGVSAEQVQFAPPGYDRVALDSYRLFKQLQLARRIPDGTRFQVSLPTPFATLAMAFEPQYVAALLPRFEAVMLREVENIARQIPPQDCAMQWDVAVEIIAVLEGLAPPLAAAFPPPVLAGTLARCCDRVLPDIELGVHLCYGNPGGRHIIEPRDTGKLVEFANLLFAQLHRRLHWIHMPVPIARDDDAYFAPLDGLRCPEGTELYLGLIHRQDGVAGAQRRMAAARRHVASFGVGTECGMRFVPREQLRELLALHRQVADANAADAAATR